MDSIEIAQVRVTTSAAGAVAASQIYQVVGSHCERADFPLWTVNYDEGSVTFLDALPEIHTGTVPKKVYASYAEPIFADVALASDFVPPETSHSVTSTQVYGTTLGATSSTLGQGTFTAYLENGVSDALVSEESEPLVQVLPGSLRDALPALPGQAGHFAYVPGWRHDPSGLHDQRG